VSRRFLAGAVSASALVLASISHQNAGHVTAAAPPSKVMSGVVPPQVQKGRAQDIGQQSTSTQLNLAIGLPLRDPGGLEAFLRDVSDPSSPRYRQYLNQEEENSLFNPTVADESRVTRWLTVHGFVVTHTYPNHLFVDAAGTVDQAQKLFGVSIHRYRATIHGHQQEFFAPGSAAVVDSTVSDVVNSIVGLDNVPRFQLPTNGNAHGAPPYYPQDFANAYDVNPLWNAGYTGTGQHIGITMWTVPPSDTTLSSFATRTSAGTATVGNGRLNVIKVDGGTTSTLSPDTGEAGMDIESSSGMAPSATVDYYEIATDSSGNPTDQALLDSLNIAGTDANNNLQITNSWAGCEASSATDPWTKSVEQIFAANRATGHNYFFSSADQGSWCDPNNTGVGVNPYPAYPSSSPNVTSVGGTRFSGNIGSSDPGETAWAYCSTCSSGAPEGSGGGYSKIFSRPSWQTGTGLAANGERGYPDISAVGDPNTGALVCYGNSSACGQFGGTSLSSPLWAGITADINQYLQSTAAHSVGFLNPSLYNLSTHAQTYPPFHDITSGTNGVYNAVAGWDAVTGIGSLDAWNLARDLSSQSLTPTPTATAKTTPGTATTTPTPTAIVQLVANGGFENGQTPWQEQSTGGYQMVDYSNPHSGSYEAWLCGYRSCQDNLWQTVTLPATVSQATLGYWTDVMTQETSTSCVDSFTVTVRSTSGSPLATVQTLCNTAATGWKNFTTDLTSVLQSHAGQQIQLYFSGQTTGTASTNFFLDDVSLSVGTSAGATATAPPAPATATPTPTGAAPTPTRTPTLTSTPAATSTPTATSTSAPITTLQLLANNGFESGQVPWQEQSGNGYQLIDYSNPHTGSYSAWLCGYALCRDSISQTVTLPAGFSAVSLSYWSDVVTQEVGPTCVDSLAPRVVTSTGSLIVSVPQVCNSSPTGWTQHTTDLSSALAPYAGKQVQVVFSASVGGALSSSFFVDDTSLSVTTGAVSPTPTRTAGPTNTPATTPTATNTPSTQPTATRTPAPTATATATVGGTSRQLVVNGGFEAGQAPWSESSSVGYQMIDYSNPHAGSYEVWMCGYNSCQDKLSQSVTLPASFSTATLTYWTYMRTQETSASCNDSFKAVVKSAGGSPLSSASPVCNFNVAGAWVQRTLDLSSSLAGFKGQAVQIEFDAAGNSTLSTDFFVDDVSLNMQ
jgi:kumamolisin